MTQQLCPSCQTAIASNAAYCSRCGAQAPTVVSGMSPAAEPNDAATHGRLQQALSTKYEVRRLLGRGGFAEVFEVYDGDLLRKLAIKVLRSDLAWTAGMLERFKQEMRAVARLSHPHILPIFFVGEGEGLVYYAMPYVDGQSLGDILRASPALSPDRALTTIYPVLEALEHAHGQGIVHRDIKPDNIMCEAGSGRILLVDFGIAKELGGTGGHQTQAGLVVGTPNYMSPEQALGQGDIDHRTDIYAVGAMLFQMVTGSPPFDGSTSQEIVGKHIAEPVPNPTQRNAKIPQWLSEVIVRCLAKKPADRYQSASALLAALRHGKASGRQRAISASRVARRIQAEAATEVLATGQTSAGETPAHARAGRLVPALLAALALALAVTVFVHLTRPVLTVQNQLIEAVNLAINEAPERRLAPGETARVRLSRRKQLVVQWYLVQPVSPSGTPMGEPMQGTLVRERPRGRINYAIDGKSTTTPYFAPLITNDTDQRLQVTVNAGLAGALDCGCAVRPGVRRARIGYYRLFRNTTIRASDPSGRVATFADVGPRVDREAGTVGLRFRPDDLRDPRALRARVR